MNSLILTEDIEMRIKPEVAISISTFRVLKPLQNLVKEAVKSGRNWTRDY